MSITIGGKEYLSYEEQILQNKEKLERNLLFTYNNDGMGDYTITNNYRDYDRYDICVLLNDPNGEGYNYDHTVIYTNMMRKLVNDEYVEILTNPYMLSNINLKINNNALIITVSSNYPYLIHIYGIKH